MAGGWSSTPDGLALGGARDAPSAWRCAVLAAAALVAGCGETDAVPLDGAVDAAAADGTVDAADAAPTFAQKVVRLESGLEVTVIGSPDYLATIDTGMSAGDLCASSWLAVTVVREVDSHGSKYAAVAHSRAMARPCDEGGQSFCTPDTHVRLFLRALLSDFDLPDEPNGSGYFGYLLGITLLLLEERETGSPWYTTVYDTRSLVPLSGFLHDSGGALLYFPGAWSSLAEARGYRGDRTWARVVDEPFGGCFDAEPLIQESMHAFFLRDLDACGIIFGLPFPVASLTASYDEAGCVGALSYIGLTLSTAEEHPGLATEECPRPASATIEYACYTQE